MAYNYRDIPQIVREILAAKAEDGGVKNVYFVGCGGSLGALYPAKVFVERESLGLKTGWINSNEFVHSTPKDFGKNSVLCVACHAGNTPETVAAAKLGRESGAAVVLLTYQEESEIAAFADYLVLYSFDSSSSAHTGDMDYAGEKTQCALQLAVELVNGTEGYEHYDAFYQGVERIGGIIRKAREQVAGPGQGLRPGVQERQLPVHHGQRGLLGLRLHGEHLHLHGDAVDPLRLHPHRGVLPRPL